MNSKLLSLLHHCDPSTTILCLSLPEKCPLCDRALGQAVSVCERPSPLVHSFSAPYSIVIKPTKGTFLETYTRDCNLHVGVCDSRGVVYDFDERGVNRSLEGWEQCVAIRMEQTVHSRGLWDVRLREFTCDEQWRGECYEESRMNCYDFALQFLSLMGFNDVLDKQRFVERRVLPQTKHVAKYLAVYRKVVADGFIQIQSTSL
ncbi:hypothetical protein CAPTEDRAFT_152855 [Capitella teleta]|uniref:MKRN2 opposite strand protein-like C-terminal domain-containing protein n=1 Tax=Capitella teleta TaxID=283909 RepID=R7T9Z9_CAPTE|nr:hypothetical protein CAPTEDRAFT_152855 [Capitella teleta]|eukprot:ELT90583.1 hypothetical protein CAPTEDRAFT_152855 [Capitella teleta]